MLDLALVKALYDRTKGAPYKLGAKWPLGADSALVRGKPVDCSGWVRWVLDRAGVRMPDGSQNQWEYVRDSGWREVLYDHLRYAEKDPSRLFIAFKRQTRDCRGRVRHGHVWLVCGGQTLESFSGVGVGSKPWRARRGIVAACYEVPLT